MIRSLIVPIVVIVYVAWFAYVIKRINLVHVFNLKLIDNIHDYGRRQLDEIMVAVPFNDYDVMMTTLDHRVKEQETLYAAMDSRSYGYLVCHFKHPREYYRNTILDVYGLLP